MTDKERRIIEASNLACAATGGRSYTLAPPKAHFRTDPWFSRVAAVSQGGSGKKEYD
jgi:hypothetical protein